MSGIVGRKKSTVRSVVVQTSEQLNLVSITINADPVELSFRARLVQSWNHLEYPSKSGYGSCLSYSCPVKGYLVALQLAKELNRPQKTTWFILQRIKEACGNKVTVLNGTVEADEAYVGGLEQNKHASKKLKLGRGSVGKQPVLGLRQLGGHVVAKKITRADVLNILANIYNHVETGSTVYSDDHRAYQHLGILDYQHDTVKHSESEYIKGVVHTNSIDRVWAILKRTITGVHHHIFYKHLQRYLWEMCYRLNEGSVDIHIKHRIGALCQMCGGARLTRENLTNPNPKD